LKIYFFLAAYTDSVVCLSLNTFQTHLGHFIL
jgi:hypothetical protein